MNPLFVDKYFLKLEPKLSKIVNTSVHLQEDDTIIGKIIEYNKSTGFAKILLFESVYVKHLLEVVPLENIIFPSQA